MPRIRQGPLKGFYAPDYDGGSIVNLLSSLVRSRGGSSPHRELRGCPAAGLKPFRNIVYAVVDGLGVRQLERFLGAGRGGNFFGQHPWRAITTVFPATTAAAVTTFATGASPAEHGILGWHLHLADLGMVGTILPGTTRTGAPMTADDFDLDAYLRLPSYVESARGRRGLLSFGRIPRSRFSLAGTRWTERAAFDTLRGMEKRVAAFARRRGGGLAYVYWPGYDTVCHEFGCDDRRTVAHLRKVDASLGRLVRRLAGSGTMLFVLADHGLVDAPPRQRVDLMAIPGFSGCLAAIPSGDARQVCCFVRPARVRDFLRIVRRCLSDACACLPGDQLLAMKVFGLGREHPALRARVGDYVLIARGAYAFTSTLPGREPDFNVGNHGGMSEDEVLVPLYAVPCSLTPTPKSRRPGASPAARPR